MTTGPQITSGNAKFAGVCAGATCYKNTRQANDVTMLQSMKSGFAAKQEMCGNGAICKSLSAFLQFLCYMLYSTTALQLARRKRKLTGMNRTRELELFIRDAGDRD